MGAGALWGRGGGDCAGLCFGHGGVKGAEMGFSLGTPRFLFRVVILTRSGELGGDLGELKKSNESVIEFY